MGRVVGERIRVPSLSVLFEQFLTMEYKAQGWFRYAGNQRIAFDAFLSEPITGVGLNNLHMYEAFGLRGAHGPLRFLAETGLLGCLGMGLFLFSLIAKLFNNMKKKHHANDEAIFGIGFLLVLVSIMCSFGTGIYNLTSTFFWANLTIVGIIIGSQENKSRSLTTSKPTRIIS